MRHLILTLFTDDCTWAVFVFAGGGTSHNRLAAKTSVSRPRRVGAAASCARQQGNAPAEGGASANEGCQLIPNGDLSQQKTNEQDSSIMKGLVF